MTTSSDTQAAKAQRHVIKVLSTAQILGGVGSAAGAAVGALIVTDLASETFSGLSSASTVIGAALIAIPVSRLMNVRGRRPGLIVAYALGVLGALLVVAGAVLESLLVALPGLIALGGGMTANLQSRYAATDLATSNRRGRALATVVWATTIGSVVGPNLASIMGDLAEHINVPRLAGPYLLTVVVYVLAAGVIAFLLRPDPLLAAREADAIAAGISRREPPLRMKFGQVVRLITSIPAALLGLVAMSIGQAVMVAVMSMTPVHLKHGEASLVIIGFVISGHITGMYVASPLVGMASDRFGRQPVILGGSAILLTSFLIAGTASGHESNQLAGGLFLLGLGWSCTLIAGSTLLTESVPVDTRPNVQGAADLIMGTAGASAGLLSGVVVGFGSYALLNVLATLLVIPLITASLRTSRQLATA